mmetsp:Transcript_115131/g.200394  ORF Transcript_115131/g.200394 Transcript_115131/m.200394 type:complete len:103 (-) Transcript_115131:2377-2685(-)
MDTHRFKNPQPKLYRTVHMPAIYSNTNYNTDTLTNDDTDPNSNIDSQRQADTNVHPNFDPNFDSNANFHNLFYFHHLSHCTTDLNCITDSLNNIYMDAFCIS